MNKEVNFEIAKLLKEKGYTEKCMHHYRGGELTANRAPYNFNNPEEQKLWNVELISAPTIAEVVMWLYENHDIYINVIPDLSSRHNLIDRKFYVSMFKYSININVQVEILKEDKNILYFNKLENAYEFGILHALKNLI